MTRLVDVTSRAPLPFQTNTVASYEGEALRPSNLSWFERKFVHGGRLARQGAPSSTELGVLSRSGRASGHDYVGVSEQ